MKRENMSEAIRLECSKHADIGEAMRRLFARLIRAIAGKGESGPANHETPSEE